MFESGRRSGIILGDSGYGCSNWIIPPYRENQIGGSAKKMNFNRFIC